MAYKTIKVYYVSERDSLILRYLADGYTRAEIGRLMNLSIRSVTQYIWYMRFELDARSVAQLISIAYDRDVLQPRPAAPVADRPAVNWQKPRRKYLVRDSNNVLLDMPLLPKPVRQWNSSK